MPNLDQFRIVGFGMGANRCIGGPQKPTFNGNDPEANACNGPVGANEPGGITFAQVNDLQLELGAGDNHVTVDTKTNVVDPARAPLLQIDTGAGKDTVDVKGITSHTFVNLGAGNDTLNVHTDQQTLSELEGLLTVSGDSPQANVLNFANGSPSQGTAVAAVDAIQTLTVDATGGSYTLSYVAQPLNLTASQGAAAGTLPAGPFFYVVTAVIGGVTETIASPEASTSVTPSATIDLAWYRVPNATSYNVYRGTLSGGPYKLITPLGSRSPTTPTTGRSTPFRLRRCPPPAFSRA